MNLEHNPPRRTAFIWVGILLIGLLLLFLPAILGADAFQGIAALSFLGGFMAAIGVIVTLIFFNLARMLDRITRPQNVLVHWKYSQAEWKQYTGVDHRDEAAGGKRLFSLIAVISVLVGLMAWALVRQNPLTIGLIVLVILGVTGLAVWINAKMARRDIKEFPGDVYIALDGLYLTRQLHVWKGAGKKLENILFEGENRQQPRILIEYSAPSREGRNTYTARIPVPSGEEETARRVTAQIAQVHLG